MLGSLAFVALGIFLIRAGDTDEPWIGWATVIFFGAGIPIFARQILDMRPRITVNDVGVVDRTLGVGIIPWMEIESAYVKSVKNIDFICLKVRNADAWLEKMPGFKRKMTSANLALGFEVLNLNLSGLKIDTDELFALVQSHLVNSTACQIQKQS